METIVNQRTVYCSLSDRAWKLHESTYSVL